MANSSIATFTATPTAKGFAGTINWGKTPSPIQRKELGYFDKMNKNIKKMAALGSGGSALMGAFGDILGALTDVLLAPLFPEIAKWIQKFGEFVKLVREKGLLGALTDMGFWDSVWKLAYGQFTKAWEYLKTMWNGPLGQKIKDLWDELVVKIKQVWKDDVKPLLDAAWAALGREIKQVWEDTVKPILDDAWATIGRVFKAFLTTLPRVLWETFIYVTKLLFNAIVDAGWEMAKASANAILHPIDTVAEAIKRATSPAKKQDDAAGLNAAIDRMSDAITDAISGVKPAGWAVMANSDSPVAYQSFIGPPAPKSNAYTGR